jgi:hypothetical protein
MLAAAAALAALAGGGAAVWIATSGDDDPPQRARSIATALEPTESAPTVPSDGQPATTERKERPGGDDKPPAGPNQTKSQDARKTTFPRERRKPQNDRPQRKFAIPPAREFSGTGNATLGTVDLRQSAVVKWTTQGRFELRFGREDFPIIAPSPSGQLIVPPYNFERVRVIARGRWKISITPQK